MSDLSDDFVEWVREQQPKKPPYPTEYEEQVLVCSWARGYAAIHNDSRLELLHGDSSGVRVPIGCAVKMKKAGAIKGWPDLFLPVPATVKKQEITLEKKCYLRYARAFMDCLSN